MELKLNYVATAISALAVGIVIGYRARNGDWPLPEKALKVDFFKRKKKDDEQNEKESEAA